MNKQGKTAQKGQELPWLDGVCQLLTGGVLALGVSIGVLMGIAALVSGGLMSEGTLEHSVMCACVLGGLVGGLWAVLRLRRRTLLVGAGVGVIEFLLLLTIGLLVFDRTPQEADVLQNLLACCCGGALAGILGSRPKKRRKR